jgi:hypothetical protein
MGNERLVALHTLSVITAVCGFMAMCICWMLALTIMPLHVYFAVHGARAAGVGRRVTMAIALLSAIPVANTLVLLLVNNRLARAMLAAGIPQEELGFKLLRRV